MSSNLSGVSVSITADSIYLDSLATITMSSSKSFEVEVSNDIVAIEKGVSSDVANSIKSIESDNRQVVEVVVTQIFRERRVSCNHRNTLMNAYGMRFYPFVSSMLMSEIKISNQPIDIILIDLPDSYRILWNKATVLGDGSFKAYLKHAFGIERSTYIFRWDDDSDEFKSIDLDVAVRLGGKALLRITNFPFMYWLLSLFIVAIASTSDKTSILLASVGAAWIFMLRQWNLSNAPQENTLLTHAYLIHGLFIPIWAATWHFYSFFALGWMPVILIFVYSIHNSTQTFKKNGLLPKLIAEYWLKKVIDK
ncbi:hypothetical protein GV054_11890 [Marinomonas mediterranea]|uniref:hypothetical protein n=1 Tax=Marinomonas mediterranea TaxID=119864 RepID=UPI002349B808|nr:hypothetical protein [Marinomonas mediterranea]WCN13650.1 hypothetical protein GV054_11890 [Marinomonas mediterranea]